ncbi:hypothetical protein BABINDRAFT_168871 [Babjeviella inositovora NRRL Y-12698]|uniref:FCP1 homology domain-containing protein n=1 Tax=Babjeviella inositovora NRRL Y-12698 TaxID=984486 RepID=A0A1E3QJP6_9ASCO|nr:uncharacterized protein BABINDRAFT_168871 [Babjeviella inositovora NRRL Y-12698]ODQ77916.1 hypothetical protein BABINDRAFT_168871 [Babjeviella inositovora NRRL Y-12698]
MGKLLSSLFCCSAPEEEQKPPPKHTAIRPTTSRNVHPVKSNVSKTAVSLRKAVETRKPDEFDDEKVQKSKVRVLNTELDNSTNESESAAQTNTNNSLETKTMPVKSLSDTDTSQVLASVSNTPQQELDPYDDEVAGLDLVSPQPGQVLASSGWLLDPPAAQFSHKKCLVLDLDETLVHSSFKYLRQADFVIPVEIDSQVHNVYVIKRPGVDEFIRRVGEIYEVVVFTASVSRYGDPLLDKLDIDKNIHHRLFRESCFNYQGNYIKNLSQMGRPLKDTIIIDNSPASYIFHPQHSVPISSWFSDTHDNELLDILPFLEDLAEKKVDDVSLVLDVTI